MGSYCTLINISAGPAVGCHGVALLRTGTLVAARDVEAAEGAEYAGTLRALINIFTGMPIFCQLEALPAVALVGTINVGTLLAAGTVITFIYIFAVLAVVGESEAGGAGAVVGTRGVLTGVLAQAPRVVPALVYVNAAPAEGVVLIAHLAVTAIAPGQIVAQLPLSTPVHPSLALVHIDTARALLIGVVASAAAQHVPLARVRPHRVDAVESWLTGLREGCAFIDIHTVPLRVLQEPIHAALLGLAVEGPLCVLTNKVHFAAVSSSLALVDIYSSHQNTTLG